MARNRKIEGKVGELLNETGGSRRRSKKERVSCTGWDGQTRRRIDQPEGG